MRHSIRPARLATALAVTTGLSAVQAGPAPADGPVRAQASGSAGVAGWSEARLRKWEKTTLGERHAAEHARGRQVARRPGERARVARELRRALTRAKASVEGPANQVGRWNGRFDIPVMGINAAMLPTGKVLWYAYPNEPDSAPRQNESWGVLWDPGKGVGADAFKRVDPPIDPKTGRPANIWCSGTSFLADGRVLATGGNLAYIDRPGDKYAGLNQVYTFNPFNETWTRQPDMAHGRWYPSQLLMPDGRTLIVQGLDENSTKDAQNKNVDVEVFTPSPDLNGVGTVTKLDKPLPSVGDYYPHMFWMPSATALIAGPFTNDSWRFTGVSGTSFSSQDLPNSARTRVWGNAVLEPAGTGGSSRVLQLGGSDTGPDYDNAFATNTAEVFDENNPGAGWQGAPSQNVARSHQNTVLLPDGSMVTVGGGVGNDSKRNRSWTGNTEHLQVELWNPQSRTWTLGPSQLETRAYHSTAILMPDARVLSAGDDRNGGFNRDTAEIYEPPYLHRGPRPAIARAPSAVGWNSQFDVATPNADVTRAALIAPGAATHAVDMNQRYVPLSVAQRPGGVTLTTPPNPNVALPGYYMLFLINSQGVPSVASWVRLRPGGTDGAVSFVPTPPPAPPAAPRTATRPSATKRRVKVRVRAKIVRRKGKRVIRVTLARSTRYKRVKVRFYLRDRRKRIKRVGTRTMRTGRTTYITKPRVTPAVRTVRIRVL